MTTNLLATNSKSLNVYAQQAAENPSGGGYVKGIDPQYYDHIEAVLNDGFIDFRQPIKDDKENPLTFFEPDKIYGLCDNAGNIINHRFVAVRGLPWSLFMGAGLSNYEQALPGEKGGSHCRTSRIQIKLGEDDSVTISGGRPIQSTFGVGYGLAQYQTPEDQAAGKKRVYNPNHRFTAFGTASKEYADQVKRPETMSCAECMAGGFDIFGKQKCGINGVLAFYVTELAFNGPKGVEWRTVNELSDKLGDGFVAIFKIGSADLRKDGTLFDLGSKDNKALPTDVQNIHCYTQSVLKKGEDFAPFILVPELNSYIQLLAEPAELWLTKLSKEVGKTKYIATLRKDNTCGDFIESRHELLQRAVSAYIADRNGDNSSTEFFGADDLKVSDADLKTVIAADALETPDLSALADTGDFFDNLVSA